ncbi:hypothetical protein JCM8202v2_004199 [Rhodotorula sphaerocarpa]
MSSSSSSSSATSRAASPRVDEQRGFLASALARLGLSDRQATPGPSAAPPAAENPSDSPDEAEAGPKKKNRTRNRSGAQRKRAKKRKQRELEEQARQAGTAPQPPEQSPASTSDSWQALNLDDLGPSVFSWSDAAVGETESLFSQQEATSYASSVLLATLSSDTGSELYARSQTAAGKLAFYQSLVLQFELGTVDMLPGSIVKCKALLRTIHIAVGDYLAVIKRGGNVAQVERFPSAKELAKALRGEKGRKKKKIIPRELIKSQLLSVFMVEVFFRRKSGR